MNEFQLLNKALSENPELPYDSLLKAGTKGGHKYLFRFKKKNKWYYIYPKPTAGKKGILSKLADFFSMKKGDTPESVAKAEYKNLGIKEKFGMDEAEFNKHFENYFSNKESWDAYFSSKGSTPKQEQPPKEEKPKGEPAEKPESKEREQDAPQTGVAREEKKKKTGMNMDVMAFLAKTYGGKKESGKRDADSFDFSKLPRDLTKLSDKQIKDIIDFYGTLPLKELRKRQTLNEQQKETAVKQGNTHTADRLEINQELLTAAVDIMEFKDNTSDDWIDTVKKVIDRIKKGREEKTGTTDKKMTPSEKKDEPVDSPDPEPTSKGDVPVDFERFAAIARKGDAASTFEEVRKIKDVPASVSASFFHKYNPEGNLSPQDAWAAFVKDIQSKEEAPAAPKEEEKKPEPAPEKKKSKFNFAFFDKMVTSGQKTDNGYYLTENGNEIAPMEDIVAMHLRGDVFDGSRLLMDRYKELAIVANKGDLDAETGLAVMKELKGYERDLKAMGKDGSGMTPRMIQDKIRETKPVVYSDPGGESWSDNGSATAGVSPQKNDVRMYLNLSKEGREKGQYTDGKMLVIDKAWTDDIYAKNSEWAKKKLKDENEIKNSEDHQFPNSQPVIDSALNGIKGEASVLGFSGSNKDPKKRVAVLKQGDTTMALDADYFASLKKRYPNGKFYAGDSDKQPIVVKNDGEPVAIVMPMRLDNLAVPKQKMQKAVSRVPSWFKALQNIDNRR